MEFSITWHLTAPQELWKLFFFFLCVCFRQLIKVIERLFFIFAFLDFFSKFYEYTAIAIFAPSLTEHNRLRASHLIYLIDIKHHTLSIYFY